MTARPAESTPTRPRVMAPRRTASAQRNRSSCARRAGGAGNHLTLPPSLPPVISAAAAAAASVTHAQSQGAPPQEGRPQVADSAANALHPAGPTAPSNSDAASPKTASAHGPGGPGGGLMPAGRSSARRRRARAVASARASCAPT